MSADPVITGIGALTPCGVTAPDTWDGLVEGRSGAGPVTLFDASRLRTRIAMEVKGFDPEPHLGPKKTRRTARFSQMAIVAAREAVADAGLGDLAGMGDRVGVQVNSTLPATPEIEGHIAALQADGPDRVSPFFVPTTIPNMPACEIAMDMGLHGPVNASALACASGTAALLEGRRLLMAGEADVVIAGGTDCAISEGTFAGLSNMGPMSENNDDPAGASRPFDRDRDGFVFGEGAVICVLETAEHAAARGARTLGTVAGGAVTADGFHMSHPEPTGAYAARAMTLALQRAGVAPGELDLVVAHGTGTVANDRSEALAIRTALGAAADGVPVTSPKSTLGHMIAAAGMVSALAALFGMRDGRIAPTINYATPDPECDLDVVANVAREATLRTAAINAFGFGGQNAVVVLRAP